MKEVFRLVLGDKITKWGMILSGIFLTIEILFIVAFYFSLPPLLPIFNQAPWGEERLGAKPAIFIPVLISIGFLVSNFFILARLYEKTPLLSRMLGITTLLTSILSFIFIVRTVFLLI